MNIIHTYNKTISNQLLDPVCQGSGEGAGQPLVISFWTQCASERSGGGSTTCNQLLDPVYQWSLVEQVNHLSSGPSVSAKWNESISRLESVSGPSMPARWRGGGSATCSQPLNSVCQWSGSGSDYSIVCHFLLLGAMLSTVSSHPIAIKIMRSLP